MARVLQIRRGTTAQNDKFTGRPGEVTFDTDAKTLRVHDGATLGGFALARRGYDNDAFDINMVPDTFWTELFTRFMPTGPGFTIKDSIALPMIYDGILEYTFTTITQPAIFARAALICNTAECGYAPGDTVWAFGIGNRTNPTPNTVLADDGLHIILPMGTDTIWVSHKTTGQNTNITKANWSIKLTVWY